MTSDKTGISRVLAATLLTLGLLLTGCAAAPGETEEPAEARPTVADILSGPLAAEEYGTPRRCISSLGYRDFRAIGDRYVIFDGPGDRLWLNELRGPCPGLKHATALAFEMRATQICDLDRFRTADWFDWPRFRRWPWDWVDGMPCTLGKFHPVTGEQVEALRAALQN